jgi:hypothetical protein
VRLLLAWLEGRAARAVAAPRARRARQTSAKA